MLDYSKLKSGQKVYVKETHTQANNTFTAGQEVCFMKAVANANAPGGYSAVLVTIPGSDKPLGIQPDKLTDAPPTDSADEDADEVCAVDALFAERFDTESPLTEAFFKQHNELVKDGDDTSMLDAAIGAEALADAQQVLDPQQTARVYRTFLGFFGVEPTPAGAEALAAVEAPQPARNKGGRPSKAAKAAQEAANAPTPPPATPAAPPASTPPQARPARGALTAVKVDALSLLLPGMAQAYAHSPETFEEVIDAARAMTVAAANV